MRKIFLTIDIECHDISKYNYYIDGKIGNEYYGLKKILEICKENGIVLNCFLDFAESHRYGDEYIRRITHLISEYNQPIHLHLHPNYITGDDSRTFLWQYSLEEQKSILKKGFEDYRRFMGKECAVFRIGRYGCDTNMYEVLTDYSNGLIDLSYCYAFNNMCHYECNTYNKPAKFKNIIILPNTRYCSFKLFGKTKYVNFDVPGTNVFEYKKILGNSKLDYSVCTMHSWSLLKKGLFSNSSFSCDNNAIKKMKKLFAVAKKKGVVFSDIEGNVSVSGDDDQLDLCATPLSYLMEMAGTFVRIRKLTRTNKKYFLIYTAFYFSLTLILALVIILFAHIL